MKLAILVLALFVFDGREVFRFDGGAEVRGTVVKETPDAVFVATLEDAANQAIGAAELDVAATRAELVRVVDQTQTTARGAQTTASNPGTTVANQGQSPITVGTVRIIFRLP